MDWISLDVELTFQLDVRKRAGTGAHIKDENGAVPSNSRRSRRLDAGRLS
jgi:hypothetical protein